jgi:hypothetical protein
LFTFEQIRIVPKNAIPILHAVVRVQPTGAAIASEAACQALLPLNQ